MATNPDSIDSRVPPASSPTKWGARMIIGRPRYSRKIGSFSMVTSRRIRSGLPYHMMKRSRMLRVNHWKCSRPTRRHSRSLHCGKHNRRLISVTRRLGTASHHTSVPSPPPSGRSTLRGSSDSPLRTHSRPFRSRCPGGIGTAGCGASGGDTRAVGSLMTDPGLQPPAAPPNAVRPCSGCSPRSTGRAHGGSVPPWRD